MHYHGVKVKEDNSCVGSCIIHVTFLAIEQPVIWAKICATRIVSY